MPLPNRLPPDATEPQDGTYTADDDSQQPEPPDEGGEAA